jgi:hypothetical protein
VPPTLVSTTRSTNFGVNNTNKNTPSVAWAAGALIVVHGVAGDNASPLTTPTVTGLTLALVTGYPTNIASRMKHYVWQVAAAAAGSSVFTATGTAGDEGGISVRVYEGHGGLGSTPAAVNNTTGAAQLTFPVSATGSVYGRPDVPVCGWRRAGRGRLPGHSHLRYLFDVPLRRGRLGVVHDRDHGSNVDGLDDFRGRGAERSGEH